MAAPYHPVGDASPPGMAPILADSETTLYRRDDDFWDADWLPRWRGMALFGAALIGTGLLSWARLSTGGSSPSFDLLTPLLGYAALLALGGFPLVFFGFTEEGVALISAAGLNVFILIIAQTTAPPMVSPPFTNPSTAGPDAIFVIAALVIGALLFAMGIAMALRTYRANRNED